MAWSAWALLVLLGIGGALLFLGALGALWPKAAGPIATCIAALCGLGAFTAFASLFLHDGPAAFVLPVGPPGMAMVMALDPLSGFFLLLLFVVALPCALTSRVPHSAADRRALPFFPVFIAAMAAALLAADAYSLVFGFELMSLASWAMVLVNHDSVASRDAGQFYLGMALFGAACLLPGLVLLSPANGGGMPWDLPFNAIRTAGPPDGWRGAIGIGLVLLGAGSKAGLAPLHPWLPIAHPAAPSHVSALMSGAMTKVALYVVIRVLFDLCGEAPPLWWGLPLVIAGVASAVLGALRAVIEPDVKAALAASTIENVGLIAIGLGIALLARAADLPGLAALALGAAMLHALNHGVFKALLFLGVGAAAHGGGSRRMDRLGGLIHQMPVTTACVLVGCIGLAALPPGSGFASEWLLLQSIIAAPRIGGLALQTTLAVTLALVGMAAALAAVAAVRLLGVVFLGRPRTPRAAAAEETDRVSQIALGGLAALTVVLGLFPGVALTYLIGPTVSALTESGPPDRIGLLSIAPGAASTSYAPLGMAVCVALAAGAVVLALHRWAVRGHRSSSAWDCGFAAAPPWLPFGDPLTQFGGASFSQILRRVLGGRVLDARETVDIPGPGDTRAATVAVSLQDPAVEWLLRPIVQARAAIGRRTDRLQFISIRRLLIILFGLLVLLLAVVAWIESL